MLSRSARSILALAIAVSVGGCAHRGIQGETHSTTLTISADEPPAHPDACPLAHIRGVHARATDVPGGVAIVFESSDRAVHLVRANVRAMRTASDQQGDPFLVCPCGMPGIVRSSALSAIEGGGDPNLGRTLMQPSSSIPVALAPATVKETPAGATLVLTATDGADADVLRHAVREALGYMAGCLSTP